MAVKKNISKAKKPRKKAKLPVKTKKGDFKYGEINISSKVRFTKTKFYKFFKGRVKVDIDAAWDKYQEYLK